MACDLPKITNDGARSWSMKQDRKGIRVYTITHRVEVDRGFHGPGSVLFTPGLPAPGAIWLEPDLIDPWAYFTREADVVQVGETAKSKFFDITQYATNQPSDDCVEEGRTDPLQQADRIRIESVEQRKEMIYDSEGYQVINSAWEQYRGPQVEIDDSKIRVYIEQNAASAELDLVEGLLHHVNATPMWGYPAGAIKLTKFEAEPKYHSTCEKYWLRKFVFDIDRNLFAKALLDEATKVLHGRWDQARGTSAVINITVDGEGRVTGGSITSSSSDFPRSCIVPLRIDRLGTAFPGLDPQDAIVLVETNSSGLVNSFIRVHKAGSGYSAGPATTVQRGQWVLLRFNTTGAVPIYSNPQHFIRPGDIHGQNTRFILDGYGMPIAEDEDPGTMLYYPYPEGNLLLLGIPLSIETS